MKDQFNEESEAQKLRDDDFIEKCLEEFDDKFQFLDRKSGYLFGKNNKPQNLEDVKQFLRQKLLEAREKGVGEIIEFLKAEKSTYSEDVAQRERSVYDHIIKCLQEARALNK